MVVTAILALLAGVVVGPVLKARDRARDAAARVELRHAMRAIDFYHALNNRLPENVAELATADFEFGPDIVVCGFARQGEDPRNGYVQVQVQHRGSRTLLETQHPIWSGRIEEEDRRCGGGSGGPGNGNGNGNPGGPGNGNPGGPGNGNPGGSGNGNPGGPGNGNPGGPGNGNPGGPGNGNGNGPGGNAGGNGNGNGPGGNNAGGNGNGAGGNNAGGNRPR